MKMFLNFALLPLRIEEEIHAFQKKFLDANREKFPHSYNARDENEHHRTLFIHFTQLIPQPLHIYKIYTLKH